MTDIDTKALALRVAAWLDRFFSGTGENCDLSPDEARALAAFLREAVSPWIKIISAEDLPKKPGLKSYEYVDCLIFHKGEIKKRPWNCEHMCWDDDEYDDFYCNPLEPSHYMPLPTPPAAGGKNAE